MSLPTTPKKKYQSKFYIVRHNGHLSLKENALLSHPAQVNRNNSQFSLELYEKHLSQHTFKSRSAELFRERKTKLLLLLKITILKSLCLIIFWHTKGTHTHTHHPNNYFHISNLSYMWVPMEVISELSKNPRMRYKKMRKDKYIKLL